MSKYKTLKDIPDLQGKRVLLRVDMNIPLKDGKIIDTTRIDRIIPTIQSLTDRGAMVIILSHLGRPRGKVDPSLSLQPIAQHMGIPLTTLAPGSELQSKVDELTPGDILLLENIRFYPGEESNDSQLAVSFAQIADIYVNDAFSVSHRAHMSVEAIAHSLPSYAGLLMEEELTALAHALDTPERLLTAIVGGAKVSSKLQILENLTKQVDTLVIGGAMANTFLLAQGYYVGQSLVEVGLYSTALKILNESPCQIILPTDVVVANTISSSATVHNKSIADIQEGEMILDIGSQSITHIEQAIEQSKTVVLNGPLGVFETPPFDQGTNHVFHKIAQLTQAGSLTSIAGGGDTVSALKHAQVNQGITYISTAGGAFLEWLEGRKLPGIEALES